MQDKPTPRDLETLRTEWAGLEGKDLIRATREKYGDKMAVLSSFGADAAVTLSLVAEVDPNIHVLFVDTGKHFFETLNYVETLKKHFGLTHIQTIRPDQKLLDQFDADGKLHETDPDTCCDIRKVHALGDYVKQNDIHAIVGGRMRGQTQARSGVELLDWDVEKGILSVNPIAHWSQEKADTVKMNLPRHPLSTQGYASIGCDPCTEPGDGRDGRWKRMQGSKTVCGINGGEGGWQRMTVTRRLPSSDADFPTLP